MRLFLIGHYHKGKTSVLRALQGKRPKTAERTSGFHVRTGTVDPETVPGGCVMWAWFTHFKFVMDCDVFSQVPASLVMQRRSRLLALSVTCGCVAARKGAEQRSNFTRGTLQDR